MMNLTFPLGPTYRGSEYSILYSANLFELICHFFLDCPFSALNFLLIFKTSILHPNLKIILLCQSACIFVRGIGRIILIIGRLSINNMSSKGPVWLTFLYLHPTFARNFIVHVLMIERFMATFMSKIYEQWKSKWFSVLWITIVVLITLFNLCGDMLISANFELLFTIYMYIFLIIFGIFEILAFVWILHYNDKIYLSNINKTLSQQYQLAENIRTSKQMIPCIILHFFNLIDGSMIGFVRIFRIFGKNQFYNDLFGSQQIFIFVSISSFLIELSMIFFHPFLKRDLLRWMNSTFQCLANIFRKNTSNRRTSIYPPTKYVPITGIRGNHLELGQNVDRIGEEYFRQLNMAWQ